MSDVNTKRKTSIIPLEIYDDKIWVAWVYWEFIQKHVKLRNKIPARVLKTFSSFYKTDSDRKNEKNKLANNLIENCIDRFKKDNYDFKGYSYITPEKELPKNIFSDKRETKNHRKNKPHTKYKVEYSFFDILHNVICSLIEYLYKLDLDDEDEVNKNLEKDDCIRYLYRKMVEYRAKLNKQNKKIFTLYKIGVLSAYITMLFGFSVTSEKCPSNSLLFQSSRNAILQLKKQKPQT